MDEIKYGLRVSKYYDAFDKVTDIACVAIGLGAIALGVGMFGKMVSQKWFTKDELVKFIADLEKDETSN